MDGKVTIYALCEPDGTPRYVGQTRKPLAVRLQAHLNGAKRNKTAKDRWLLSLAQSGARPVICALAVTDERGAQRLEEAYIARYRTAGLLTNALRRGARAVRDDASAEEISVMAVRMTPELKARIALIAQKEERSISWMTRRLIAEGVELWRRGVDDGGERRGDGRGDGGRLRA